MTELTFEKIAAINPHLNDFDGQKIAVGQVITLELAIPRGGEQPDDQASPVAGALSGGIPRSKASESEAQ